MRRLRAEGGGFELEDGEVGEDVFFGVEELVVEDAGGLGWGVAEAGAGEAFFGEGLAGDPFAVGPEEGLGGLAFDDGEEGLLAPVWPGR